MKLDRKILRRLIKEEMARAVQAQRQSEAASHGGSETALPTDQVMALIGAGFDVQGVNQSNLTPDMIAALRSAGFFLGESAGYGYGAAPFDAPHNVLTDEQLMNLQMILDGGPAGPNYMSIAAQLNAKNLVDMVNSLDAYSGRGEEVAEKVFGGGRVDPVGGIGETRKYSDAVTRAQASEASGMGSLQSKRVPAAEMADADLAALWAWVQKNAPTAASSAMEAIRGGAAAGGHWTGGLNVGSPESEAGVFPEGITSLSALLDESIGLERAQQVEMKLKDFGMDDDIAWSVTNDLLNAAAGYAHAANSSGMLSDDMIAEISAAGDVSDEILQKLAGGDSSGSDTDDESWESAWTKYSGSPAGTKPVSMEPTLSAGEDS